MPQGNDVVDCGVFIDDFWRCVTIGHQWESFYRVGQLDGCEGGLGNIYTCLKAKAQSDEDAARQILRTQIVRPRAPPEPLWKEKDTPSWD
jgi:hypothetical protein